MAVTSTNNLRQGSKGSDVTDLQRLLNQNGYNLTEDGSFGPKTSAAVKDYQRKNGLEVDGIVGTNTWGALTNAQNSSSGTQAPSETTPKQPTAPTFSYQPSDTVKQADALLQQHLSQKPGGWQGGTWQSQLNETIKQILNRDKFTYDLNGDAMYQQYTDQYVTQGKLAMMDAMGQAAAMTGGYGSSFAQTAGQQAYQAYLQKLNDVVPELYGMALDQHNQETQNLYNQAGLMAQMDEQEYGRYQDKLSQYYTDLNYLTENARYMSETEYQKALDDFNIKYGAYRDDVADKQWQATFDEGVRQYNEQMALGKSKSSVGGTGGKANNGSRSEEEIKAMQAALGFTGSDIDGKWGPKTQAAAQKQWGTSSADAAWEAKGQYLNTGPVASDYADWDAGDWEGYFARIRQSEGKAAAQEELQYFTSNGLIPTNMVNYAAIGARGGQMGH